MAKTTKQTQSNNKPNKKSMPRHTKTKQRNNKHKKPITKTKTTLRKLPMRKTRMQRKTTTNNTPYDTKKKQKIHRPKHIPNKQILLELTNNTMSKTPRTNTRKKHKK